MNTLKVAIGGLILGAAVLSGGCASSSPPVPANDPFAGYGINITVQSPMHKWLRVGDVKVVRDGLMTVVVPVRLAYEDNNGYPIQYKFTFLDQSGRPLAAQTDWKLVELTPRVEKIIQGTALDAATDWRLEIRSAVGGQH